MAEKNTAQEAPAISIFRLMANPGAAAASW
jgi:hypothetical protein